MPEPGARLVRVITRMNVGGPARHVTILATQAGAWNGILVTGSTAAREGTLEPQARERGAAVRVIDRLRRPPAPLDDLLALIALYRLLRRERPWVVATHTAKAGTVGRLAAFLARVPVRVHTFHGQVFEGYFGRIGSFAVRAAERALGALTSAFVAISPEIRDDLLGIGISPAKVALVPLGLELDYLVDPPRGRLRREFGIPDGAPVVAIVGRLAPIKNHRLLFEAAPAILARRPDARFVVVGDGELWDDLHQDVAARGLAAQVLFTGWRQDLANVYGDADVVVCCSLNEGTPVSIIEAGAAGRPAVGTRVGGMPDIISDGQNGLLVPSRDAPALAAAIVKIIEDARLASALGEAGRRRALQEHSSRRMVQQLVDLYTRLVRDAGLELT